MILIRCLGCAAKLRKVAGSRRSIQIAWGKLERSHVDFPVPRGPNKKKFDEGAEKKI